MIFYLYVKTQLNTGLKYLGQTRQNPYKYLGSGTYWLRHLKKHGNNVSTEILHTCQSKEEISHWGSYYSKLWNIVDSNQWANLMEEKGDGVSSEQSKKLWADPCYRAKQKLMSSTLWKDPEYKEKQRIILKERWKDSDFHAKVCATHRKRWQNEEYRQSVVIHSQGKNNGRYDHTIYHFMHKDGREETCERDEMYKKYKGYLKRGGLSELINGNLQVYKGWRIKTIV